jgi:cell division protease FtsH
VAWFQPIRSQVHKVSIIPRGRSLGATQVLPEEDQLGINETQLNAQLAFAMGGRCAEKLFFDEFSSGAEQDLKQATQLARRMVVHWGMSERLGPIAFRVDESHPFLGREMSEAREYSDETARVIDEEVVRILRDAYDRAAAILQEHRDKLEILSRKLEEEEELEETRIIDLIGPSPFRKEEKPEVPEEESKSDEELESGENGVESSKKDGANEEDEKNGENEKTE